MTANYENALKMAILGWSAVLLAARVRLLGAVAPPLPFGYVEFANNPPRQ